MEIWQALKGQPDTLIDWYGERYKQFVTGRPADEYERIRASYNKRPNGADLIFLCRACYGGVVRFRQADGYMSTPCGVHRPISPEGFAKRVIEWRERTLGTKFCTMEFEEAMSRAKKGDLVYCDPPYSHTQSILYGAQSFSLDHLLGVIDECKRRGVYVALSIDGTKKSGNFICELPIPKGLFSREMLVDCGRSMLKRFQMKQRTLETEVVADRLLLTY
jgi:DNA adenine methylase